MPDLLYFWSQVKEKLLKIPICHFQAELLQSLEDNDLEGFATYVGAASEAGADLNHQYGAESGFKTILHLALEEDDGLPYVEELLKVQ